MGRGWAFAALLVAAACAAPAPVGAPAVSARPAIGVGAGSDHPSHGSGPLRSMGGCSPAGPVHGALPGAPLPGWCQDLVPGVSTAIRSDNTWLDEFGSQQQHAQISADYEVFEAPLRDGNVYRSKHFAHNDHWMVDVATRATPPGQYEGDARDLERALNWGGAVMRPAATFSAVAGRLVIEADVSASMAAYGDDVWPELIVTTAPRPTGLNVDRFNGIGVFGGAPAVGCRLMPDRGPICSALDASGRSFDAGGEIVELSATKSGGATRVIGGAPVGSLAEVWRTCGLSDPDAKCRDRFRLEIEPRALRLIVNGVTYMEHAGLPSERAVPSAILDSPVYVYFASWIYLGQAGIARFHWDRIAINPR